MLTLHILLQSEQLLNMNEKHDDHVSFSASKLVLSRNKKHLLVCIDDGRMLVFALQCHSEQDSSAKYDLQLLQRITGIQSDTFFVPCAAWHPMGGHVIAADARGSLQVRLPACSRCAVNMMQADTSLVSTSILLGRSCSVRAGWHAHTPAACVSLPLQGSQACEPAMWQYLFPCVLLQLVVG